MRSPRSTDRALSTPQQPDKSRGFGWTALWCTLKPTYEVLRRVDFKQQVY